MSTIYPKLQESFQRLWWLFQLGAGISTIYPKLQESFQTLGLYPTWELECQLYTQSCRNHFNDFGDCIQLGGWNVNYIPKVAGIISTTLVTVSTWGLECQLYTQSCRNHFNDFGDCIQLGGWNVNYIPKVAGIISTTLVTASNLGAEMSTIYPKLQESFQRLWWLYPAWGLECQLYTQSCRNHFNDFGDCIQLGGWNVNYIPKVAGIISTTLVTASNLGTGMSTIYPKLQESFQRLWWLYPTWGAGMSTIYPKLQESFQRLWWLYPAWGLECQLYTQSCRNHFNDFGDCIQLGGWNVNYIPKVAGIISTTLVTVSSLGAGMSTIYPKLQESFQRLWWLYPTWGLECQLYTQSCRNHFNDFGDCIQLGGWNVNYIPKVAGIISTKTVSSSRNVNYIPKVAGIISTTLVTVSNLGAGMSTIYPKLQESFQRLWDCPEFQLYTQTCRNHFNNFSYCVQLGRWNVNYIPKVAGIISTTLVTVSSLGAGMSTIYPKLQESFQRLWWLYPAWGLECQLYTQSCRNHFNDFGDYCWNVQLGGVQLGAGMSTIYPKLQGSFHDFGDCIQLGSRNVNYIPKVAGIISNFGDCIQLGGWNVNYIPKVAGIISTTLVTVSSLGAGMSTIYPKLQESFQRLWWLYPAWGLECQLYTQSCRNHFNDFGDCIQLGGWNVNYIPKVAGIQLHFNFNRLWWLYPAWGLECQLYTQSCRNHFNDFGDFILTGMSTIYPKLQSFQRLWWLYPAWGLECQLYTQSCRNHFNDFGDCIQLGGWNVNYIPKVAGIISTTLVTVSNLGAGMSTIYPKLQEGSFPTWDFSYPANHFNFGDCIQLGSRNVNYIPKVAGIISTTLVTVSNLGAGMSTIYPKLQESFQRLWWLYPTWGLECQLYTQSCRNHFNDFGDCIQLGGWNVNYIPKVAGIISTTLVTASNLGTGMSTIYPKLQESFQRL